MSDILRDFKLGRHEFEHGSFTDITGGDPYKLMQLWLEDAVNKEENEPNAFVLSTVDEGNQPSSRILYLKDIIEKQFVFYTNYNSQKGIEILGNDKISMLFFWPKLSRQIRINGICTKVDSRISDEYFASRPRASQIGAWASAQSEELTHRDELEVKFSELEKKFTGEIPRPPFWGGYQVKPSYFEFWQGRPSRLHDRLIFKWIDSTWKSSHKNP